MINRLATSARRPPVRVRLDRDSLCGYNDSLSQYANKIQKTESGESSFIKHQIRAPVLCRYFANKVAISLILYRVSFKKKLLNAKAAKFNF